MNKELRELLNQINAKKKEIRDLIKNDKIEEAKTEKQNLITMQDKFDVLMDLEDSKLEEATHETKPLTNEENKVVNAFASAIKAGLKNQKVDEETLQVLNSMKEGSDKDGGLTVPKDISTKVKERRRSEDALELIVNVEHTATQKGSRVIEKDAENTPFDNVEEEAEFPELSNPEFENVEYNCKKKGGILKISSDLLEDTAEALIAYITKWLTKKSKATRNALIIAMANTITKGQEITVENLDDIKFIFNVMLDPAMEPGSVVVTNQSGFNWLDTLKTSDGKYAIQPDPTQASKKLLFGLYPIKKISNKTLKNINGKAPIFCGDFKEAITLFDRDVTTVDISDQAGDLWAKDQTGLKARERLDVQPVDEAAIVKGLISITIDNTVYTKETLDTKTIPQIKLIAAERGYTITKTVKSEIITEFLAQQNAV